MVRKNTGSTPEGTEPEGTPEAPAEGTETPTPEAPAPDLTEFLSVVESVVATRDAETGEVNDEGKGKVTTAYRALDPAGKRAAKDKAEALMMEAVHKLDGPLARAYSDAKAALIAGGGSKADKTPADPGAAYVQRMSALILASEIAAQGAPTIEGRNLADEVTALVTESREQAKAQVAYLADESEDKGDGPELSSVVRTAFKLSSGKAAGSKGKGTPKAGPNGDIGKHVVEAFADYPSGHVLKVSELAKFKSTEYPNGDASQGAVTARLFPKSGKATTIPGVTPIQADESGPKRASKV